MKTNSVVFHSLGSIQRNGRAVLKAGGVGVDGHGGHHAQHHDNGQQQRHKLVGFFMLFTSFLEKMMSHCTIIPQKKVKEQGNIS